MSSSSSLSSSSSSSLSGLKAELEFLASIFHKDHEQLRIVSWQLDELQCQFLVPPEPAGSPPSPPPFTLYCTITESYPSSPPMWFVDSDDPGLTSILARLEDWKPNSSLRQQLKWLICEFCSLYNLPEHLDVEMLDQPVPISQKATIREEPSEDEDAAYGFETLKSISKSGSVSIQGPRHFYCSQCGKSHFTFSPCRGRKSTGRSNGIPAVMMVYGPSRMKSIRGVKTPWEMF